LISTTEFELVKIMIVDICNCIFTSEMSPYRLPSKTKCWYQQLIS